MAKIKLSAIALAVVATLIGAGCGPSPAKDGTSGTSTDTNTAATGNATGPISIDGSSTVLPILEAVSEEFQKANPDAKPTVGKSGTGGGFKKFAAGEIDIANASRPIEEKEIEACKAGGVEFIEVPIAFDGLSVVVHPENDFITSLTVAELKKMWEPNSKVTTWADVRPGLPAEKIKLYGAGTDSGTFDYFTKAIVGTEKASRTDYQASEDDNTLVQGVGGDKYSLGYFGYAYYLNNKDKLKLVQVDGGKGPVAPSVETISDGTYQPLSRPLFVYVNVKALDKPQVKAYFDFLFANGRDLITSTGYVPLPDEILALSKKRIDEKKTGTVFRGAETGLSIKDILGREGN